MNSFGRKFSVQVFGESHGKGLGLCIDGIPVGLDLSEQDFIEDLKRRQAGAKGTTPRIERDLPEIMTGVFNGKTTGAPLNIWFKNENVKSKDYSFVKNTPRPGHSDWVANKKYKGFNDFRGGGHFSGRLTLNLVAAGVIAKKILKDIRIEAKLIEAGGSTNIEAEIDAALKDGDSIGGLIECKAQNIPVGIGEPFFDSIESMIAHLVFAVPATKGVEFGSGFAAARMKGSEHNDIIINDSGKTESNNSGGINGGITNGNELIFRVAIKPTSSISKSQLTYNSEKGGIDELKIRGRHDACIALRAPVVIEAICAIAIADLFLIGY